MDKIVVTPLERRLMLPLVRTGRAFWIAVAACVAAIAWGAYAYSVQLENGLAVTGMRDRVSWGLYIATFVFFIGVSYGGTLVSALLRLTNAEWRRPITRLAEAITAVALLVSTTMVLADVGRPDRALNLILSPRTGSPLIWDLTVIGLYFVGSLLYLYLPMIPDLAILRRKMPRRLQGRRSVYALLAMRWRGMREQHRALGRAVGALTVLIIPVAVAAHTVTAWIFGMTLRVGWHTALLGPYFVVGALFSGVATVVIVIAVARRALHLEPLLRPVHFRNLGLLMLALDVALLYFTLNEYVTALYGGEVADVQWVTLLANGAYAAMFWGMVLGGFLAPALILAATRARSIRWTVLSAVLISVGMWIERFLIVVGSLITPQTPSPVPAYWPTWVEWSIMAAAVAGFSLLLLLFAKAFPVVPIAEMQEAEAAAHPEAASREVVT